MLPRLASSANLIVVNSATPSRISLCELDHSEKEARACSHACQQRDAVSVSSIDVAALGCNLKHSRSSSGNPICILRVSLNSSLRTLLLAGHDSPLLEAAHCIRRDRQNDYRRVLQVEDSQAERAWGEEWEWAVLGGCKLL